MMKVLLLSSFMLSAIAHNAMAEFHSGGEMKLQGRKSKKLVRREVKRDEEPSSAQFASGGEVKLVNDKEVAIHARANATSKNRDQTLQSVETSVQRKGITVNTLTKGKLKQTGHAKCMAAASVQSGAETLTTIVEAECDATGEYGPDDLLWQRESSCGSCTTETIETGDGEGDSETTTVTTCTKACKQIKLQDPDRDICLEAQPSSMQVFGRPCITSTDGRSTEHADQYKLQQWTYDGIAKEVKMEHDSGNKCLATMDIDPAIVLRDCDSSSEMQRWQITE